MICRFQYTNVAEFVLSIIDPVLANYQSAVGPAFPQTNGAVRPCFSWRMCAGRGKWKLSCSPPVACRLGGCAGLGADRLS